MSLSEALPTTPVDAVWSLHAETLQATSDGLAQGPYVAARAGTNPRPYGRKATTLPMLHHAHI